MTIEVTDENSEDVDTVNGSETGTDGAGTASVSDAGASGPDYGLVSIGATAALIATAVALRLIVIGAAFMIELQQDTNKIAGQQSS